MSLFRALLLLCFLATVAGTVTAEQLPVRAYTTADGLASDDVRRVFQDSQGFLWFCTNEGLSRFDGYEFTNYGAAQGLPHHVVTDIVETPGGEYWIATLAGLAKYDPSAPRGGGDGGPVSSQADAAHTDGKKFVVYFPGDDEKSRAVIALF